MSSERFTSGSAANQRFESRGETAASRRFTQVAKAAILGGAVGVGYALYNQTPLPTAPTPQIAAIRATAARYAESGGRMPPVISRARTAAQRRWAAATIIFLYLHIKKHVQINSKWLHG